MSIPPTCISTRWSLSSGRLQLDGHADFFAEPSMAMNADLHLHDIALADVLPLTAQHQVHRHTGASLHRRPCRICPHGARSAAQHPDLTRGEAGLSSMLPGRERRSKTPGRKRLMRRIKPPIIPRSFCGSIKELSRTASSASSIKATNPSYRMFISRDGYRPQELE